MSSAKVMLNISQIFHNFENENKESTKKTNKINLKQVNHNDKRKKDLLN